MAWKNAKRTAGYASASGAFVLLLLMGLIVKTNNEGAGQKSGTPVSFLLSMCGAALLGVASIMLLRRSPQSFKRGTGTTKTHWQKQRQLFYFSVVDLLNTGFASPGDAKLALDVDIKAITAGTVENYTVNDLERLIVRHLAGKERGLTLVRPAFDQVRRGLEATLHIPRRTIRPSTRLERLFPKDNRADLWAAFFQELKVPPPPLELSDGYKWIAVLMMLPFLCLVSVGIERGPLLATITGIGGFILVLLGFRHSMQKLGLATWIPLAYQTVGNLARQLARKELQVFAPWTEDELKRQVQEMLSRATGIPNANIRADTRLSDLGIHLSQPS